MNTLQRLHHLHAIIKEVPADRLKLSTWWDYNPDRGCLIGHACQDPKFQAEGLFLVGRAGLYEPSYRGYFAFEAVSIFFGIGLTEAYNLTLPNFYDVDPTKEEVLDRIQNLIQLRTHVPL